MTTNNNFSYTRHGLRYSLGFILSAGLLFYLFRNMALREAVQYIQSISIYSVLFTIVLGYVTIPLRTLQWRWLLGNTDSIPFRLVFKATCLGYLGNCLFPMRGGEFVKAYLLSRESHRSFTQVMTSVAIVRLQDLIPMALLMIIVTCLPLDMDGILNNTELQSVVSGAQVQHALKIFGILTGLLTVLLLVILRYFEWVQRIIVRVVGTISFRVACRIDNIFLHIHHAIQIAREANRFWVAQGVSILCWCIYVVAPIPLLMEFEISFASALCTSVTIVAFTTISFLLPSAPGGIGTFHYFCMVAIQLINPTMAQSSVIAYTFLAHIISTVTPALPGLIWLPTVWNLRTKTSLDVDADMEKNEID